MDPSTLRDRLIRELEVKKAALAVLSGDVLSKFVWNEKQREFLCDRRREVMLSGLNQGGKSTVLCADLTYHLTGQYPEWHSGQHFNRPINAAIGGETAQSTRDLITNRLLGEPGARGTGMIPKELLGEIKMDRRGVVDQVESFKVKHFDKHGKFDGWSKCYVFSYSKGFERIQGYTLDLISIDEEPDFMIYDEFSARLNQSRGYLRLSMTPLHGQTDLWIHFSESTTEQRGIIYYDIRKATHWTEEHRQELIEKYTNHPNANARLLGQPVATQGVIYNVPDELITCDPFLLEQTPTNRFLIGLDFPHTVGEFAAVRLMWDEVSDIIYLTDSFKAKGQTYIHNAHHVERMGGKNIPVAWPHDGGRQLGDGMTVAGQYQDLGLNMIHEPAAFIDIQGKKSRSIWAAIEEVFERMSDGRFKVFSNQYEFFREKSLYRHEDGKIVKGHDHLIDALHKAIMMLRYSEPLTTNQEKMAKYDDPGASRFAGDYDFFGGF